MIYALQLVDFYKKNRQKKKKDIECEISYKNSTVDNYQR